MQQFTFLFICNSCNTLLNCYILLQSLNILTINILFLRKFTIFIVEILHYLTPKIKFLNNLCTLFVP